MTDSPSPAQEALKENHSLRDVVAFLLGEAPLEGRWFGDAAVVGKPFWWRKHLRRAWKDTQPPAPPEVLAEALRKCREIFYRIKGDFLDPRTDCLEGMAIIDDALAGHEPVQQSEAPAPTSEAERALLLAAGHIGGMKRAALHGRVYGSLGEAYMAAEATINGLAEKLRRGEELRDHNGLVWKSSPDQTRAAAPADVLANALRLIRDRHFTDEAGDREWVDWARETARDALASYWSGQRTPQDGVREALRRLLSAVDVYGVDNWDTDDLPRGVAEIILASEDARDALARYRSKDGAEQATTEEYRELISRSIRTVDSWPEWKAKVDKDQQPPDQDGVREALADLFIKAGLCQSRGEFRRHLYAGAVNIGIGKKMRADVTESALKEGGE